MPTLERRISLRGPRFFKEGAVLMFINQLDGSTRDGPRAATDDDRAAHPEALAGLEIDSDDPPGKPLIVATDVDARPAKVGGKTR